MMYTLSQSLTSLLSKEAKNTFLAAVYRTAGSDAHKLVSGFVALQKEGYKKCADGVYRKQQSGVRLTKIMRSDDDKREVFGYFSVVEVDNTPVVDRQGDIISSKELEEAAYRYVRNSRMGDERHDSRCKAVLIESMYFSKEKQALLNIDLGFVGWWGGFKILDEELWQKIKSGEYRSFSIGGVGRHVG